MPSGDRGSPQCDISCQFHVPSCAPATWEIEGHAREQLIHGTMVITRCLSEPSQEASAGAAL